MLRPGSQTEQENAAHLRLSQAKKNGGVGTSPKKCKPSPKTPAPRIPLSELVGNGDVKPPSVEKAISPEERVLWKYTRSPQSTPQGLSQKASSLRPKKRRARSSSPASSPGTAETRIVTNPGIKPALKTPKSKSLNLWNRFSGNDLSGSDVSGISKANFAYLISESSPKLATGGTVGLRRSMSCGVDWPASKTKRRRLNPVSVGCSVPEGAVVSRFQLHSSSMDHTATKRPNLTPEITSSAVPAQPDANSPLRQRGPLCIKDEETASVPRTKAAAFEETSGSSDYGDFEEIDEELGSIFEADEAKDSSKPASQRNSTTSQQFDGASESKADKGMESTTGKAAQATGLEDIDEFDDQDLDELLSTQFADLDAGNNNHVTAGAVNSAASKPLQNLEPEDDEFGSFDDDLFVEAEAAESTSERSNIIRRYRILDFSTSQYESQGRMQEQVILKTKDERTDAEKTILLRGGWVDSSLLKDTYVSIIGRFNGSTCIIDDNQGLLILHPDFLISATVVADSYSCIRRAVLQDRVKATGTTSAPLIYGTILHEVFQSAMKENRWDDEYLQGIIDQTLLTYVEGIYEVGITTHEATSHLRSKLPALQAWAEIFISPKPHPKASVRDHRGSAQVAIRKLIEVEEHVWSPRYGLKGNIDATVEVILREGSKEQTLLVPLELKTGKNVVAMHRAQTALYTLLLSDRYDIDVLYGILYYMESSETQLIRSIRHELRQMILQRNELAGYIRERRALPGMLRDPRMCGSCYAQQACFLYHKILDDGDGETSYMKGKFEAVVKHLKPHHKEFFLKWDKLITLEEKDMLKFKRELWTMTSQEREAVGRCYAGLIIEPDSMLEPGSSTKTNRYQYTLTRKVAGSASFMDSQMNVGDPIVISDEIGHYALSNGYIVHIFKQKVVVAVDRKLHNTRLREEGFDDVQNQTFSGIMALAAGKKYLQPEHEITYRLDKDEFSNGMSTVRNNLVEIMSNSTDGNRRTRELVVDLEPPRFLKGFIWEQQKDDSLNEDQQKAIEMVMRAQDYALILGMPGTGKTTTIAQIIRALVKRGKSVLLTSYTHTAVDNILLKLEHDNLPILRIGAIPKIHRRVQQFAQLANVPKDDIEQVRDMYQNSMVVGTTCLGINHGIFNERYFDYCIVDEASQITLPTCLGPIRMAKRFILVGDHYQLPPLVRDEEAKKGGLEVSLFKLLSEKHPVAFTYLSYQYRMCKEIMLLSNTLIYDGRLKCGTDQVAESSMDIPSIENLATHHHGHDNGESSVARCPQPSENCWLYHVVSPQTKVSFLNTDLLDAGQVSRGAAMVNPIEAEIVSQVVESLVSSGVHPSEIGVISPYKSQLRLLQDSLRHVPDLEMHTVDKFQGRDKECIIMSLVRNNEEKNIGELLQDQRRINVAFTRAKTKLLVVGSMNTLNGNKLLSQFFDIVKENQWVYDLPKGATEMHHFENINPTQFSRSSLVRKKGGYTASSSTGSNPKKTQGISQEALVKGRPILGDILKDMA